MKIKNKVLYQEFIQREEMGPRASYLPELDFYHSIKSGDIKKVKRLCAETLPEKEGLGTLSRNKLQNLKYHFAITTALVSRFCIEGGMDFNEAYTLSDYYILSADECNNLSVLSDLHITMCLDYTKRMQQLRKAKVYSKPVAECIDYIYDNLHTRITVNTLAEEVGLSPSYLSRLFKEETSLAISEYILDKKIDTAKSMLRYSDYSVADISEILAFPSQSYFTEVFKKHCGMTPFKYRKENYRTL